MIQTIWISNDVFLVITSLQNCEIGPLLMNTDRPIHYAEWKIGPLFSVCCLKHWSRMGAEQAKNMVSGSGAVSRCEIKLVGAGPRDRGDTARAGGHGAGSGSHRNRFQRRAEIQPLPLRSHAPVETCQVHKLAIRDLAYPSVIQLPKIGLLCHLNLPKLKYGRYHGIVDIC